jgi:hypothetical protein
MATREAQEARIPQLRLDAILLEEHPLVHACAREAVGGEVGRALGEVQQDRSRLGNCLARVELEHGDAPVRIAAEVLRGARLALEQVHLHALVRQLELAEQDAGLHAVPRGRVVVQDHVRNLACAACAHE